MSFITYNLVVANKSAKVVLWYFSIGNNMINIIIYTAWRVFHVFKFNLYISIAGYGSGVRQGKVEERVRSGDGSAWTAISSRRRRRRRGIIPFSFYIDVIRKFIISTHIFYKKKFVLRKFLKLNFNKQL